MSEATGHGKGKVILLGEHGVVYDRPALAAGLAHGASARVTRSRGGSSLEVSPWQARVALEGDPPDSPELAQLREAFAVLCAQRTDDTPVAARVDLELPAGAGLGSSAALGVAVLRALDRLEGRQRDATAIADACMAWERVFHGNPSGVDNAVAAAGGLCVYRRSAGLEQVPLQAPLQLVVGYSGEAASTKRTVADVARQHAEDPRRVEACFDAIADLVTLARQHLAAGDVEALGPLLDANQAHLVTLGLSTPQLDRMCLAAREAGALGAKLTGGGGGGCMVALAASPTAAERVQQALVRLGYDSFATQIEPTRVELTENAP